MNPLAESAASETTEDEWTQERDDDRDEERVATRQSRGKRDRLSESDLRPGTDSKIFVYAPHYDGI